MALPTEYMPQRRLIVPITIIMDFITQRKSHPPERSGGRVK
jgi:hypothetical protein